MDELFERWQRRQTNLGIRLEEMGAAHCDFRVDLGVRKFFWVDAQGVALAAADTRVLCSYALSDRSVLMAWANPHLDSEAAIEAVPGMRDRVDGCDEADAWQLAVQAADAAGADYVYRAPGPQTMVFLGLWNLRMALAESFEAGSPAPFVLKILISMEKLVVDPIAVPERLGALLANYGETLNQQAAHLYLGSPYFGPLKRVGNTMIGLGKPLLDVGRMDDGRRDEVLAQLIELRELWEALAEKEKPPGV
ncbi:MAG: hypothetical protein HY319_26145 [Armatimonadetes bacterium]|nr:hypothetical protein [Armatimonadota bacterium]